MNPGRRRLRLIFAAAMAIMSAMAFNVSAAERKVHFDVDGLT